MDRHLKNNLLNLSNKLFTQHIFTLIKTKKLQLILSALHLIANNPRFQQALAPIYPKLASIIRSSWAKVISHPSSATIITILNNISVNYINHLGCDCGKQIISLYLPDEITHHMQCTNFVKNILLHLPLSLKQKYLYYLDPSYKQLLKKQHRNKFIEIRHLLKK